MEWEVITVEEVSGIILDTGDVLFQYNLPTPRNGDTTANRLVKFADLEHGFNKGDKVADHKIHELVEKHNLTVDHLPASYVRRFLGEWA